MVTQEHQEEDSLAQNQQLEVVSLEASLLKHHQEVVFLDKQVDHHLEEAEESSEVKLNKLKEVVSLEVKRQLPLEEPQQILEVVFSEEDKHQVVVEFLEVASLQVSEEEQVEQEDQYSEVKHNQQQVFLEEDKHQVIVFNQPPHGVVIKQPVDFLNRLKQKTQLEDLPLSISHKLEPHKSTLMNSKIEIME